MAMSELYRGLIAKYDRRLVDAALALFHKQLGGDTRQFDAEGFCSLLERTGKPDDRAKVWATLESLSNQPEPVDAKVQALRDVLDFA
jgi:hypothetical protein